MNIRTWPRMPLWAWEILGPTKSFKKNPLIGDPDWNRRGLHRWRVATAARMAASRRARLAGRIDAGERAAFDENGYFLIPDYLPADLFTQLRNAIHTGAFSAREMRQGTTVTRMTPLGPGVQKERPVIGAVIHRRDMIDRLRYAGSHGGAPLFFLQTVIAEAAEREKGADPQTMLHADTFHPTSKAWLFLHDVGVDDGPFAYVPGSHRLTEKRLQWEYEQSLTASLDTRSHHAQGSFRIDAEGLAALDLPPPMPVAVAANTLVVADTFGFHGRTPSSRPTMRVELHGHMRRNPFHPWTGLDVKSLPGLGDRALDLFLAYQDFREKRFGKRTIWRDVGTVPIDSGAHI